MQVEDPPVGVLVGKQDAPVAIRAHPDRAETNERELPLQVGVRLRQREEFRGEHRADVELVHLSDDLRTLRVPAEVDERDPLLDRAGRDGVKMLRRILPDQLPVKVRDPVELRLLGLLRVRQVVIDGNDVGVALHRADHDQLLGHVVDDGVAFGLGKQVQILGEAVIALNSVLEFLPHARGHASATHQFGTLAFRHDELLG